MTKETLEQRGFFPRDKTISMLKANLYALLTLPVAAVGYVIYALRWGWGITLPFLGMLLLLAGIVIGIVVHEFFHGFTWQFFCDERWKGVHFGFAKEAMSPYCHCMEVLTLNQYRLGIIMPCLMTAVLPYVIAYMVGCQWLMILGLIMFASAGGDLTILFLLIGERNPTLVVDHPTLCGCILYDKKEIEKD